MDEQRAIIASLNQSSVMVISVLFFDACVYLCCTRPDFRENAMSSRLPLVPSIIRARFADTNLADEGPRRPTRYDRSSH